MNGKIVSMESRPSNSSTTGISSMRALRKWGYFGSFPQTVLQRVNIIANSSHSVVEEFARGMSQAYVAPFADQTSSRPARLVQLRSSKVVTKVPKAAIWTLGIANCLFSLLAVALAVAALLAEATTTGVHQVQTRLNITGLAAQLFEKKFSEQRVKSDEDLFEDRDGMRERIVKRVAVEPTDAGGAIFALQEGWEE
ncbi:hypothetical protein BDV96DRAFT_199768 [Lophiotrema nucula]|uniref:Uncharacterized protein n=1 Tax=Lophiotrema nucula TaxID=690887 RepID=A0A6A5YSU4_9PLEO|nr:hypothetical protein BDV96DRAFT_199768 [Lophiotrema nucula]